MLSMTTLEIARHVRQTVLQWLFAIKLAGCPSTRDYRLPATGFLCRIGEFLPGGESGSAMSEPGSSAISCCKIGGLSPLGSSTGSRDASPLLVPSTFLDASSSRRGMPNPSSSDFRWALGARSSLGVSPATLFLYLRRIKRSPSSSNNTAKGTQTPMATF